MGKWQFKKKNFMSQTNDNDIYYTDETPDPPINENYNGYISDEKFRKTNCSIIYVGHKEDEDSSSGKYVFKFIKRKKGKENPDNEVQIMNDLNHPNILRPELAFPYNQYVCIITKFARHETLDNIIDKHNAGQGIPEDLARIAMRQMLEAVKFLHENHIMHRDIKPDNFLVNSWAPDPILVILSDFGFAKSFEPNELFTRYIGTPDYAAPEIHCHIPYDSKIDIWSLGITLFKMLTNQSPLPKYSLFKHDFGRSIRRGNLNLKLLQINKNSIEVIDLIQNMCQKNPKDRLTAEQALNHSWFSVPEKPTNLENKTKERLLTNEVQHF